MFPYMVSIRKSKSFLIYRFAILHLFPRFVLIFQYFFIFHLIIIVLKFFQQYHLFLFVGEDFVSNLATIPRLNNSIFASGLEELEITVNFNNSLNFLLCQWNVWMDLRINIFSSFDRCPNPNCKIMEKYYVLNLTITDPIPNYLNVTLSCSRGFNGIFSKSWLWRSKGMKM